MRMQAQNVSQVMDTALFIVVTLAAIMLISHIAFAYSIGRLP